MRADPAALALLGVCATLAQVPGAITVDLQQQRGLVACRAILYCQTL